MTRTSTFDRVRVADPLELALLQHAQQLHLQRRAHRPDFVEKQRALVRLLEASLTVADGAGERAAHVAEELGLEQRLGNRAAVQRDEPVHAPRAVVMNRARDDFLAGAGLAGDQDRAVGRRDGLEQLEQPLHRPALADDAFEAVALFELRAQVRVLRFQPPLLERRIEHVQQLVDLKRLADEIPRAALDRFDRVLHRAVAGDDDRDDVGVAGDGGFDDRGAVDAGQAKVGDDDVEREVGQPRDGRFARFGLFDVIAAVGQLLGDGLRAAAPRLRRAADVSSCQAFSRRQHFDTRTRPHVWYLGHGAQIPAPIPALIPALGRIRVRPIISAMSVAVASHSLPRSTRRCGTSSKPATRTPCSTTTGRPLAGDELVRFLRGHERAITGLEVLDEAVFSAVPELRMVSKYGVGLDMIDLAAAVASGVSVRWTPGVNRQAVAELAIAFMLVLVPQHRHARPRDARRRLASARRPPAFLRRRRHRRLRRRRSAGGASVPPRSARACSRTTSATTTTSIARLGVTPLALDTLLAESDFVTVHVPLDASTRGLIGAREIARMKPSAFLVNTARGGIVDEAALKAALIEGRLAGAACDVYAIEPPVDRELLLLPNFVGTPHIGGSTEEAALAMGRAAITGSGCDPDPPNLLTYSFEGLPKRSLIPGL